MKRFRHCLLLGTAIAIAPVQAQEAPAGVDSAGSALAGELELEPIVVTARKRTENLRDVPVSITALGGDLLTEAKINQVVDLSSRVPNFTVSTGSNLPFALIRGFGSGNNISFDQAVGKFIDNVSYGRDQDIRLPMFDVERVEVLKGPQVLLYGNSATAGALNITTRKPGADFAADGSVSYEGYHDEVTAQGGVTIPLTPDVGLRLSGFFQNRDNGPTYNLLTDRDEPQLRNHGLRGILQADLTDDLTVSLKAEYGRVKERGVGAEAISQPIFPHPTFGRVLMFDDARFDGRTAITSEGAPFFQKAFVGLENQTYQADISYDLGKGSLDSTTAFRTLDFAQSLPSASPVPVLNAFLTYRYKQFSEELRYTGSFDKLDVTAGGYYQRDTFDVWSAIDFNMNGFGGLSAFSLNNNLDQTTNSYSLFADVTYHFTDRFSLELGARQSWIDKRADQFLVPGMVVPGKTFGSRADILSVNRMLDGLFVALNNGVPPHVFTGLEYDDSFFQPQAVIQYELTPDSNLFLKYVRGQKAGGFDYFYAGDAAGPTPAGAQFASERAESVEAGLKGTLLDRRLDYSLVAFRTTFTDLQASQFETVSFVVTNVGKARTQGLELDVNYVPIRGMRVSGSAAYLDAKYLDYPGQPCTLEQKLAHAAVHGTPNGCVQSLSGAPTQFSSKWTGALSVDYTHPVGAETDMVGGVTLFARSGYNASPNNEPLQRQGAYAKIDAHVGVKLGNGSTTLSLFAKNLTDKRTLEFATLSPFSGDAQTGVYSLGREIGVRVGFEF
ncbi:TonB-dependent receptor [Niveispirillum fermenti]|uniref:TonB-dependent receptor n=1 Tax=Niveispirillum fermenti TaxID=1233113 RepID=UPI003A8A4386